MKVARTVIAVVVLVAGWWAAGGRGEAAELNDASWWWRGNTGPAPLPRPPTVPEGGLLVAGAPDGATAVAAVRYTLADGETSPILTLRVAENGDQGGQGAVIGACASGSAWAGGEQGGNWDAKPNAACGASVQGLRSEDGLTWTFALEPLVTGTEVNVILTPGTVAPDSPVGSTFSLAFLRPDADALATTQGEATAPDGGDFVPDAAVDEVLEDLATGALDVGADTGGLTAFQPALPASSQGLTATAPVVRQRTVNNVVPPAPPAKGGAIAFLVLLAAAAVAVRLNKIPVPGLRRLGPLAGAAPHVGPALVQPPERAGLGRFARPRVGAPPPLV